MWKLGLLVHEEPVGFVFFPLPSFFAYGRSLKERDKSGLETVQLFGAKVTHEVRFSFLAFK